MSAFSGKKGILTGAFLSTVSILMLSILWLGIQENENEIEDLNRIQEEFHAQHRPHRISEQDLIKYRQESVQVIENLQTPMKAMAGIAGFCFLFFVWHMIRYRNGFYAYDGLALVVLALLFNGITPFLQWMTDRILYAHNPTIKLRIAVMSIQIILSPALFFLAFYWNKTEMQLGLHQKRWISVLAFTFGLLSGMIALIIGLGLLMTPNLSGNIT